MKRRNARALARIASEHLLASRDALDSLGRGVTLVETAELGDSDVEAVNTTLERIYWSLPEGVRDLASTHNEDDLNSLVFDGGTVIGATTLQDAHHRRWVMVAIASILPLDDLESLTDDTVNALNMRMPGLLFMLRDDYAAYATAVGRPIDLIDQPWITLVASLAVETHTRSNLFQRHALGRPDGLDDPIIRYHQAEAVFSAPEGLTDQRLDEALDRYRASLPENLRELVDIRRAPGAATIEVPFHERSGATTFRIHLETRDLDHDGEPWTPAGLHLRFDARADLSESEALHWCQRFNGVDGNSESDVYTMPWLSGNWCAHGSGGESVISYQGYASHLSARYADISDVIDGSVREIWGALNKLRLHREFEEAVKAGGIDVQA